MFRSITKSLSAAPSVFQGYNHVLSKRFFQLPAKHQNVVKVYTSTPRLISKNETPLGIANKAELKRLDPDGWRGKLVQKGSESCLLPGDIVRVYKTDRTHFSGMVISIKRNGLATNFTLRNKVTGLGVESRYQLYSPTIQSIELVRRPVKMKRRAKLYYVRGSTKHDVGDLEKEVKR
ncbi:similar to Saccharomyces cerevisiae YCR046C IMG1 Mitochondrial ribosomal protein of the large subunit [Geotrichum candidum]|uniref:Similar to Saccharomyces cerevisiae YCR046C IMG1 Mitochondrial ribosomal protein of the large subunit n=1 Tax=Geotrichum candidum TaxID=1173061 RepID=A0A0J9XAL2_GEOCN|nr:similar to Saccharomyces cerevisiae YCR046C IMG1 Mitochondrial ribosomal protein of the large subunit [Geotrichum candidum]